MKSNATLTDSGDSVRAIAYGTVATREPSLKKSRPYGRVSTIAGPSESFLNLTRKPSLEPPARFEPTVKGSDDVVI